MNKPQLVTLDVVRAVIVTTRNKMMQEGILDPSLRLEARLTSLAWSQLQADLSSRKSVYPSDVEFKTKGTMFGVRVVEQTNLRYPGIILVNPLADNTGDPDYIRG